MTKSLFNCLIAVAVLMSVNSQVSAVVVFNAGFEYPGGVAGEPTVGTNAANLNGMFGQVGTFSGTIPVGAGGSFAPELMGFGNGPSGRILKVDRPNAGGSFNANLDGAVNFVAGGTVSFGLATARTQGNNNKNYFITGFDAANNQSFRLRVNANSSQQRLNAIVSGGTVVNNFTTTVGNDASGDMSNVGQDDVAVNELALITLNLGASGYNIEFNRPGINSYITDSLAYNGSATELTRIEFTFKGGNNDGLRTGYFLDNLVVDATVPEPTTGLLALLGVAAAGVRRRRVA